MEQILLFSNIILFERYYNGQIFEANFLENKKKKTVEKFYAPAS